MGQYRIEKDTMGEVHVPTDALYAAQTQRAVLNFPISRLRFTRPFIRALGLIKSSAAQVNGQLGELPKEIASTIELAAEQVVEGVHDSQFVLDIFQTGSGTSTNMNANEVIARLATQKLNTPGLTVHPNDHVNRSQSSNDVIPTAIHIAAAELIRYELLPAMSRLAEGLRSKAEEFDEIIKIGRTHLQDAVPIRLGQEFRGYRRQVEACLERVHSAVDGIYELPLGGTAVGTGLNAPAEFAPAAIRLIARRTRLPFREARDHFEAQGARDAACFLSGALKTYAVALTKIANDIRWLACGPRCGFGELQLPAVQPGSSIMPGKVNPVIIESLLMACAQVIGHDATITWCCAGGQFELNVMMPVMAHDLLESLELLTAATRNFNEKCIREEIGYDKAAALAKEAYQTGRTVREVASVKSGIPEERLNELLDPARQTGRP
jgi:fumarate hydratase class II